MEPRIGTYHIRILEGMLTVRTAESLNSTIPVTPNVPLLPCFGFPESGWIAFDPVSLTTFNDNVPLTPSEGAKYATAPLFPGC
jgi:hypothetical protein